jgi:sodium-dependent dicarboxylate transporter 2/3/5
MEDVMKSVGLLEFDKEKSGLVFEGKNLRLLFIGIVVFFAVIVIPIPDLATAGRKALAILFLCMFCYANEGIPKIAVSMLMVVLSVSMGLIGYGPYAMAIGTSPLVMLFCLFVVSSGITNTKLAQRISYSILLKMGTKPRAIISALIISSVIVSMLIANMPACLIMAAIGYGILKEMGEEPGKSNFGKAVFIGISTGTIVGGLAFISSSGANPTGIGIMEGATEGKFTISYLQWASMGIPFVIIMTPILCLIVNKVFKVSKTSTDNKLEKSYFLNKKQELGKMEKSEIRYIITLVIMMVLFLTISITHLNVPMVAMIALVLVCLPGWGMVNLGKTVGTLPWTVIFFAAVLPGFAGVVTNSGLGPWLAKLLFGWVSTGSLASIFPTILVICIASAVFNLTMGQPVGIFVPSVTAMALAASILPGTFVFPVICMSACSVVMPLLPDSLLTYGYGYWKYRDMLRFGWILVIPWIILIAVLVYFIGPAVGLSGPM